MQSAHRILALFASITMVLAWLLPNHYPPWLSFYNESAMAISLVLVLLSLACARPSIGIPPIVLVVITIAAIPWIQLLSGALHFSGDAWVATLYLLGLGTSILIGFQWNASSKIDLPRLIATATLIAACVSGAIGLVQALNGSAMNIWSIDGPAGMRASANLGQPNHVAVLTGFGLISLMYLHERSLLKPAISTSLVVILIFAIGATRSRTSLIYGPFVALCIYVFGKRHPGLFKTKLVFVIAATIGHWLTAWYWPLIGDALMLRTDASLAERGIQTSGRIDVWSMFLKAATDAPWMGYGWMQTAKAQLLIAYLYPPVGQLFAQAHNLAIELVIWNGIVIGAILIGIIAYWFLSRATKVRNVAATCGYIVVGMLAVHSMFEFPEQYAYFLLPAGLWIGVIENSIGSRAFFSFRWSLPLYAIAALLLFELCREYIVVEDDFRLARFEYLKIGNLRASQPSPDVPLLSNLAAYSRFYRQQPTSGMSEQTLSEMRAVTQRYPYAKLLYGYSASLALNGRLDEAHRIFLDIRLLHGERVYKTIKGDVIERVDAGQTGLRDLSDSLP